MKAIDLAVEQRSQKGKSYAKKLRKLKKIPAVLFQKGTETIPLELVKRELHFHLQHHMNENILFNLNVNGQGTRLALISEIQTNPLSDEIIHVDFHGISMTEKVVVKVSVHEVGEAPGVKEGGVLDHAHREVEVECLPGAIPERLDVDISKLAVGDSIHVRDIVFPEGVVCLEEPDLVVLSVLAPQAEEVEEAPELAEAGSSEPEVIKKGKEAKEDEAEGEEK